MANQPQGLNGLNPLSYMGVNPGTPPNLKTYRRAPTENDSQNFLIGAIWLFPQDTTPATALVWMLTALVGGRATWQPFSFGGSTSLDFLTDSGTAVPVGGILSVLGGDNINTEAQPNGSDNLLINLNTSIFQPATTADQTSGMYALDGNRFLYSYGPTNTFVGSVSGNLTLTTGSALNNTGIGGASLSSLTTGSNNTGLGSISGNSITTGSNNLSAGSGALDTLTTGSDNIVLGVNAGEAYTTSESSNIIIGNAGVVGEDNVIRIGTQGTGAGEQEAAYLAGVYNTGIGATYQVTFVDSDGKLGASTGTDGQVLIGDTGGSPVWANITSTDGSLTVVNGPNTIDISKTLRPAFHAYQMATVVNVTGDATFYTVLFDTVRFDTLNNYDTATGTFTVSVAGIYMFYSIIQLTNNGAQTEYQLYITAAGNTYDGITFPARGRVPNFYGINAWNGVSASTLVQLDIGDTVFIQAYADGGAKTTDVVGGFAGQATYFYGYMVS